MWCPFAALKFSLLIGQILLRSRNQPRIMEARRGGYWTQPLERHLLQALRSRRSTA